MIYSLLKSSKEKVSHTLVMHVSVLSMFEVSNWDRKWWWETM